MSVGSSSSFGTWPSAKVQPFGSSWNTCLVGPPVAGRQSPRETSVSLPSGPTSSSRAATCEVSPGSVNSAITVADAHQRVAAGRGRVEPVGGGAGLVGAVGGGAGAAAADRVEGRRDVAAAGGRARSSSASSDSKRISPGAIFAQLPDVYGPPEGAVFGQV